MLAPHGLAHCAQGASYLRLEPGIAALSDDRCATLTKPAAGVPERADRKARNTLIEKYR